TPRSTTPTPTAGSATPTPTPDHTKCGDARLIGLTKLETAFKGVPKDQEPAAKEIKEVVIANIKYQNFQGENDILQRMDAEILTAAEYSKKVILTTLESEKKS